LKRFLISLPGNTVATWIVEADHFSVNSQTGGAQFYRYAVLGGGVTGKDELVAAAPGGSLIRIDEKSTVLDATLADLSDPVLDKLAEALDVDELNDEQKIRIAVTWAE
jgi:hypothetical protein